MTDTRRILFWRLSLAFGLVSVAFILWFGAAMPPGGCGGDLGKRTALAAFQQARTATDMFLIFGTQGTACHREMADAMIRLNLVDLAGFIWAYTAFILLFLAALADRAPRLVSLGVMASLLAAAFDALETWTQIRIARDLTQFDAALPSLAAGYVGKFSLIAVASVAALLALDRWWQRRIKVGATVILLAALAQFLTADGSRFDPGAAISVMWTAMLIIAALNALRRPVPLSPAV